MDQTPEVRKLIRLRELMEAYAAVPEQEGDEAPGRWFLETDKILREIIEVAKNGVSAS
jgi:hypothetical protein